MKLDCQSCLLQFDAVGSSPIGSCPRCGSRNVSSALPAPSPAGTPPATSGTATAFAPTIAQPMAAPFAPPPANPPSPFSAPVVPAGSPFGAPAPPPYGAPAPPPYGAPAPPPYGAPAPPPYGAPAPAYGAQPAQPPGGFAENPYAQPVMPAPFGAAPPVFGAIPSGMTPYGSQNLLLEGEQRRALTLSIIAVFLIWPFAIAGFLLLQNSRDAGMRGDFVTALQKAKNSQLMGWIAIGITAGIIPLACLAGMAG
jgi:hypothetical protein